MSYNRIISTTLVALGCATLVGTLFAQYLPDLRITSTIENATIMVRNIFLSPTGRDRGNASIKLEGEQGNVSIGGDLVLSNDRYSCPDQNGTGCVLAVKPPDGSTDLTEVSLPQTTTTVDTDTTVTGDSFFAKKGGSIDHLNRSANEIVFADPDIVPNAADAHLRVNIKDVVRATTTGTPKMVDVNGAINSRTSLEVSSPLDTTQKSNYNLTNTARTDFILTKGDTATNEQSVRMKVGYHNGSQYTRQDMIISPIEVTQSPMVRDGIYCITKSSAGDYGVYGSRIYKSGFNRDSVGIENDNNDTYAHMHTSPQWQSSANPSIDGPSIRNGVRIDSDCDGTKDSLSAGQQITLGYSYYNTGSNRIIYVGMFGDNEFTLKVNDQTIIDTPLVPTSTNRWIEYRLYHIFPVEIKPGMNYFNIVGVGDGSVSDTIGMTIYNNTADQIKNATSNNNLNILFSTEQLVGQRISIATCPDGWILDTSGGYSDYVCRQTDTDITSHTGAKLGVNISGYPQYTLDINGETLSQETLTVGYLNSGNIVTNIRQSVGIVIQNPSQSAQTAIRSQSCDRAPIPSTLQCNNGNCSTISLSGSEIASYTCYNWVGTSTTMQRAQMYQIMSLYSSVTLIADTNTQSVGINTLRPQSTLDVNGESYLDGSGYIVGTPNNIASITNGNTSVQLKEINNTESTPYTGGNTSCKGLSVDEDGHIILVQLPTTMCGGATGSIVTPPTPTVINGVCGSAHNTTGTSAPTANLCSTGTASSIAGSGPWTWSCAGSNSGTNASCQMNKTIINCSCPAGYSNLNNEICSKTTNQAPTINYTNYCLTKSPAISYSAGGTRIYKPGFSRSAVEQYTDSSDVYTHMDTIPQRNNDGTYIGGYYTSGFYLSGSYISGFYNASGNYISGFYLSGFYLSGFYSSGYYLTGFGGDLVNGPGNRNGVWIDSNCDGIKNNLLTGQEVTLGYNYYNTGSTRTIYVGAFGDNEFTLKVNNLIIIKTVKQTPIPNATHFSTFHIFPVIIRPGINYFNIVGESDGWITDSLGMQIYDNTADEIKNSITDNNLNILFSSSELDSQRMSVATCPNGRILDTSGGYNNYICRKIEYQSCI